MAKRFVTKRVLQLQRMSKVKLIKVIYGLAGHATAIDSPGITDMDMVDELADHLIGDMIEQYGL